MKVLSTKGLEKIAELQDKYKFQNEFEINEPDSVLHFLESIRQAEYLGLCISDEDSKWIDNALENLIQ